jgi:nucleotide-binding universal stress UspA family protein
MILLCYDGSADAQAAIDHAARLMPGAEATVLTVWEPFVDAMAYSGSMGFGVMGYAGTAADASTIDEADQQLAHETAVDGAQRASEAGLVAQWRVANRHGTLAGAIIDAAADVDADVIVCGTRGRSGVKSFLLGSVSHQVVQHADRAVLVVPSPTLAEKRRSADPASASRGVSAAQTVEP